MESVVELNIVWQATSIVDKGTSGFSCEGRTHGSVLSTTVQIFFPTSKLLNSHSLGTIDR